MPNPELVIILLAVAGLWGVFLLPSLFESRKEAPLTSTQHYGNVSARLNQIQGGQSIAINAVQQRLSAKRRRTLLLTGLAAIGTLVAALMTGSIGWLVGHLVVDAFLAWYVAMLVQIRQQEQSVTRQHYAVPMEGERRVKVIAS